MSVSKPIEQPSEKAPSNSLPGVVRKRRQISYKVAPFPRERFLKFLSVLKVQTKDFGLETLGDNLLGTQHYLLDELERGLAEGITTFVILKARQLGMSTIFLALDLFWAFEHGGLSGCIATHADQNRDQIRSIVEVFMAHLPTKYKLPKRAHNRSMIIFGNGSQYSYLTAGTKQKAGKKAGLGRGGSYNFMHRTETAYWGAEDDLKELQAAMSTHYEHRLQIDETTANGFNFFQERYETAKESPSMRAIFIGWWRSELNQFDREDPRFLQFCPKGEKEPLTVLERERCQDVLKTYGYKVTIEQIAWYRWKLEDECGNDQNKMDEIQPWTDDDAFQATGSKFFTGAVLTAQMREARKQPVHLYAYKLAVEWMDLDVIQTKDKRAGLRVWQYPDPDGEYVIGCDPAYGSSPTSDRHAISIFRCYSDRMEQVAEWVNVNASTYQCAWVLAHLCGWYKIALVILEINGPGEAVFNELNALKIAMLKLPQSQYTPEIRKVLENMRHFLYRRVDSLTGGLMMQWKTNASSKHSMMSAFKDSVDLSRVRLNSMGLLEEMRSIQIDDGSIEAEGEKKDDRVIAAGLAHEAWKRWIQPKMIANGKSYAKAVELARQRASGEAVPLPSIAQAIAINYLKNAKIIMPTG